MKTRHSLVSEGKTAKETYKSLKDDINELWNEFENLDAMASLSEMRENIWNEGHGNDCIKDIDWLFRLQKNIAEIINKKPPLDSAFISTLGSINDRYEKIKEYSSKMLPFIEKNIADCDSILKEYGYDHAWMDFDDCKQALKDSLKVLKKLETAEDDYLKKDKKQTEVWKKLMEKCEELYSFANYVLVVYDIRELNWRKLSWIYNGKKDVEDFLDYTFDILEKNKNSFEKNMYKNENYIKSSGYWENSL